MCTALSVKRRCARHGDISARVGIPAYQQYGDLRKGAMRLAQVSINEDNPKRTKGVYEVRDFLS